MVNETDGETTQIEKVGLSTLATITKRGRQDRLYETVKIWDTKI